MPSQVGSESAVRSMSVSFGSPTGTLLFSWSCFPSSCKLWQAILLHRHTVTSAWKTCRRMYDPATGLFEQGNIQDWQHSGMYAAFMISGLVDLAGYYTVPGTVPCGSEHVSNSVISLLISVLLLTNHYSTVQCCSWYNGWHLYSGTKRKLFLQRRHLLELCWDPLF